MTDIYIVSGVRTAIGTFNGALKDTTPSTLITAVTREAVHRSGAAPEAIGLGVIGQVIHTEVRDMYISRVAVIEGGLPQETPAITVNRLCGSGLQAILIAANSLRAGDADVAVAGGVENMTRGPYHLSAMRFGQKMGDTTAVDAMVGALTDPFGRVHMGITAENVAVKYEISREEQDALAVESHTRAARAVKEGRFKEQILGIELKSRKGSVMFDTDEHLRYDANLADMAKLRPAFKKDGTVTAGNASGVNDGAAAVVIATGEAVKKHNLKPMARIVSAGHSGVDPAYMGTGPIPASKQALERAGLKLADIDVIEANEAFAAQACAVAKGLGFDPAKVNPNGSGISLGHPIGATGAIITIKAIYELHRTGGRYGLITMCIGGGQGIAAIVERV